MTNNEYRIINKLMHEIICLKAIVKILTEDVAEAPITKGVFGTYKCKTDIIKRDKDLIHCLILMKMHMKKLVTLKEELSKAMEEES